jgi:hypothetical protein
MAKKYRLLKDLPDSPAGTIFIYHEVFKKYESELSKFALVSQWSPNVVENNPEWFAEVIDVDDKRYSADDLMAFGRWHLDNYLKHGSAPVAERLHAWFESKEIDKQAIKKEVLQKYKLGEGVQAEIKPNPAYIPRERVNVDVHPDMDPKKHDADTAEKREKAAKRFGCELSDGQEKTEEELLQPHLHDDRLPG